MQFPYNLREKLLLSGPDKLSDVELLATFIGCGTANRNCLELAIDLLSRFGNLRTLLQASQKSFTQITGVGDARFAQLKSVQEMVNRADYINLTDKTTLSNSQDTNFFLKRQLREKSNEVFVALFLNGQNQVLAYEELFQGSINHTHVHPRVIIERALHHQATAIILAHNHPSGNSQASCEDIKITKQLTKLLQVVDILLIDHLIIADNQVTSVIQSRR